MSVWPSWRVLQLRTMKSRVRLSGNIIFRLRLHQHPESCGWSLCGMVWHQVCPGVVSNLGTPPSAEVQDAVDRMTYLNDHPEAVDRMTYLNDHPMVTRHLKPPVGGRVKCRMKRFNETRSLRFAGSRFWCNLKVGLGILQLTSAKRCPQVWPCFGRSLFSTNFVEFDQAV